MVALIIPLLLTTILVLIFAVVLWQLKKDDLKRKTIIYILVSTLLFALIGFLGMGVGQAPTTYYLVALILFAFYGIIHAWAMYPALYWTKKRIGDPSRDSFLPEFVFTLLLTGLGLLAFYFHFNYQSKDTSLSWLFASAVALFPLAFLILKAFHFATQIKAPDFEKKARWKDFYDNLGEEATIKIRFLIAPSLQEEKGVFSKKSKFNISVGQEDIMGNAFRYGVEEINEEEDDEILDLERDDYSETPDLWWLFTVKFNLFKPNTWTRTVRYLDPFASVTENKLREGDVIVAKRIVFD